MFLPYLNRINNLKIILGSSSPRRRQILENIGIRFQVLASDAEENVSKLLPPSDFVLATAELKVAAVAADLARSGQTADLIIGADTCVALDEQIFGKPVDADDAVRMLRHFSGRTHSVYTGVVLMVPSGSIFSSAGASSVKFIEATAVKMASVDEALIAAYVATGEPLDKAGGYGIQALGGTFIEGIQGDYFNVMGFPVHRFSVEFSKLLAYLPPA